MFGCTNLVELSVPHGTELLQLFDQFWFVFLVWIFDVDSVCTVRYHLFVLFLLRLVMLVDGSVEGCIWVSFSHGFQSGQCIDYHRGFRLEVKWVVLHALLFLRINVLVDRGLVAYN